MTIMKLNKIISFFAAVVLASCMASCSDDDTVMPIHSDGEAENTAISYDSLSFEWDKIAGAVQYGYELSDNEGNVVCRDVTELTNATIGSLKPATEYTLKVWGYPAIGSGYVQSEPIVLKATTDPLTTLDAPVLSGSQAEVTYTVTWSSVKGATGYEYTLTNAAGEGISTGTTTSREVAFPHLDNGNYTIEVKATSTTAGYEATGEAATLDFNVNISALWSIEGTYTSAMLGKSWSATILSYGGGHYTIKDWYGISGYNFDFYIDSTDPDNMFHIYDYYDYNEADYCYEIPTGRADLGSLKVYTWDNESEFEGSGSQGDVKICVYHTDCDYHDIDYVYDTFTWKYDGISADAFVGTWNVAMTGSTYVGPDGEEYDDEEMINVNNTITVTKIDDNTVSMPALYYPSATLRVKVDMVERTITASPVMLFGWLRLAGTQSQSANIIGRINDDGSFEFNDWTAWYSRDPYMYDCKAKYTR